MSQRNPHACALAGNIVKDFCGDIVAVGGVTHFLTAFGFNCWECILDAFAGSIWSCLLIHIRLSYLWMHRDDAQAVCNCLLTKGRQSFREIARSCRLSVAQLREALVVLLQHNWISCHRVAHEGFGQVSKAEYIYEAQLDRMLQIIRSDFAICSDLEGRWILISVG